MRTDCTVEQVYNALPRSKEKAASARTIASTNDWFVSKATACIETIEAGLAGGLPGQLNYFLAGGQRQYWLENAGGEVVENKPLNDITWQELIDRLPIGKENAKQIEEIAPEITNDQFYRRISTARHHERELDVAIYSEAATGRKYVYWKETDADTTESIEKRIQKILKDDGVSHGSIVVEKDGYEVVYRKRVRK